MPRIADAEKLTGNKHWTLYDGRGGVWRADRDGRIWRAVMVVEPRNAATRLNRFANGHTLLDCRKAVAAANA